MSGVVWVELGIDCADPERQAAFWAAALDRRVVRVSGAPEVHDPAGSAAPIWFQPVPEDKVVKNRLHLDVWLIDEVQVEQRRDRLVKLGATETRRFNHFWVMADPEGNEFCLCWGPTPPVDPPESVRSAEHPT